MITAVMHVGLSVVSLDRSIEFYRDLLGMTLKLRKPFDGPFYSELLGLPDVAGTLAILEGADTVLELFEFEHPTPKPAEPMRPVCDHGITHFCVAVTDIDSVHLRLSAAGVRFHCAPLLYKGTLKATYARDPDGNVIEMIERVAT